MLHDGRDLRRFHLGGRTQVLAASASAVVLSFSFYGAAHAVAGAAALSGIQFPGAPISAEVQVVRLQGEIKSMQSNVDAIRRAAELQAARVAQHQAVMAAILSGKGDTALLSREVPQVDAATARIAAEVIAPLRKVEAGQSRVAAKIRQIAEARYNQTLHHIHRLGIAPERFAPRPIAVGGPYEPVAAGDSETIDADTQFRSLFLTWKKLDSLERGVIAIPSAQPVTSISFSSLFGVRRDPFRSVAAMHPGVDIPGAIGTPIYATADGMVGHAERTRGYGNMIELNHGHGIMTRYGHLSKILITPNTRVKRGQLIALMGSTGRSTGSHLHYEVRIDGRPVDPVPFLQTPEYLLAVQERAIKAQAEGRLASAN